MCGIMKVSTISLVIFVMVMTQGVSSQTPVRKCRNDAPLPLAVHVDSCTEMPCDLWKGYDTQMVIQFVATRNGMTHLRAEVQLTTLGIQIPYELEEERSDVCQNLMFGAYCPLYKEEDVTYHLSMPIAEHQPEVPTTVEVSLLDSKDNSVVSCFVLDARVKRR